MVNWATVGNNFGDFMHYSYGDLAGGIGVGMGKDISKNLGMEDLSKLKQQYKKSIFTKKSNPELSWIERRKANKEIKSAYKAYEKQVAKMNRRILKDAYKDGDLLKKMDLKNSFKKNFKISKRKSIIQSENKAARLAEKAFSTTGKNSVKGLFNKGLCILHRVPILGSALKKVGVLGLALSAAELISLHSEAKKHNVKATFADYGKKALSVTAGMAGYAAGAKLGAMIGTTICPGYGTAIGIVLGMVIGGVASWLTKKTSDVVVKTDLDKAQEQNKQMSEYYQGGTNGLDNYFQEMTTVSRPSDMYSFA